MGIDLAIFPLMQYLPTTDMWLYHTRIEFHRDSDLFTLIKNFRNVHKIPKTVSCHGYFNDKYQSKITDAYGATLRYVEAKEFDHFDLPVTDWNKIVLNFIRMLPKETKILLYWH